MPGDPRVFLHVKLGENGELDLGPAIARIDVLDEDRGTDKVTLVMDDHAGISTDVVRAAAETHRPVTIEMGWEGEHAVLFMGRVHRIESYARSGQIGRLQFECRDMSELLNVAPALPNRPHAGSLDTILSQLATEAGIALGTVAIDPMPNWPDEPGMRLNQGSRTSWAMIQDIARDYNARAFVEVNSRSEDTPEQIAAGGVPRLYFYSEEAMFALEPLGKLTLCQGFGSLINFQITQIGAGAMPAAETTVIDPSSGEVCTETGAAGAAPPEAGISGSALDQVRGVRGDAAARSAEAALEVTSGNPPPPADPPNPARTVGAPSDCTRALRHVQPDPSRALGLSATGLAMGTVFLRAKASVDIEGHSSSADGRWYLRKVNHVIEQSRSTPGDPASALNVKTYRTSFEATR